MLFLYLSFPMDHNSYHVFIAALCARLCQALAGIIALTPTTRGRWYYCVSLMGLKPVVSDLKTCLSLPYVYHTPVQGSPSRVEGGHGRREANLGTVAFLRGKPCTDLFEFLQKEEAAVGSSSYLISRCSIGYLSRTASCFHGFPGPQAPPTPGQ